MVEGLEKTCRLGTRAPLLHLLCPVTPGLYPPYETFKARRQPLCPGCWCQTGSPLCRHA